MAVVTHGLDVARPVFSPWTAIWAIALAAVGTLYLVPGLAPWAVKYPADSIVPIADWIGAR